MLRAGATLSGLPSFESKLLSLKFARGLRFSSSLVAKFGAIFIKIFLIKENKNRLLPNLKFNDQIEHFVTVKFFLSLLTVLRLEELNFALQCFQCTKILNSSLKIKLSS